MLRYTSVPVVKMSDDGRRFPLEALRGQEAVRGLHGLDPDHLLCFISMLCYTHSISLHFVITLCNHAPWPSIKQHLTTTLYVCTAPKGITPSKLKCGIPIWKTSEGYWYSMPKKFVFPKGFGLLEGEKEVFS